MPLTKLRHAMTMEFCLSCHRAPEKFLRPREEVFRPQPKPLLPQEQERQGLELVKRYHVQKRTDCITCHR
jgi:nitrate/TMAO reductase-like tetraheme cytochrome c subunit